MEQFVTNILKPVSDAGARINIQAEQLYRAINIMAELELITHY